VLLEDQDRTLWDRDLVAQGTALAEQAFAQPPVGAYTIQAMIAATHAAAPVASQTNWRRIVTLYDLLLRADPTPVVALNRAVAVAMCDGPEAGLELIDPLASGELATYRFAHAARADLLRRLGRTGEARAAYERALALAEQAAERQFLQSQIGRL
jgi:RNA polymerase sigma-70 factor (ECF subfamily)